MDRDENQGPTGGVVAHLTIRDGKAAEAVAFYKQAFGAEEAMAPHMAEDGKRIMHAHLLVNGGHLMLNDDFPEYGTAATAPGSLTHRGGRGERREHDGPPRPLFLRVTLVLAHSPGEAPASRLRRGDAERRGDTGGGELLQLVPRHLHPDPP